MVKFSFELSDMDAENFMSLLRYRIGDYHMRIQEEIIKGDADMIAFYKASIEYTEQLCNTVSKGSSWLK